MTSDSPRRTSPIVVALLIVIALLLAVIAGGVFFLLRTAGAPGVAVQAPTPIPDATPEATAEATTTELTEPATGATSEDVSQPIAVARSNFGGVEVQLDRIDLRSNALLMTFTATNCSPCQETYTDYSNAAIDNAYVVDDASQSRYDVIRGADNAPLVNGANDWLDSGARMTFSLNFTPPPPGSVVNVFLPDTEPFVGIALEPAGR